MIVYDDDGIELIVTYGPSTQLWGLQLPHFEWAVSGKL